MPLRLAIKPEDHRAFGPCACCGNMTQRVWGYVEDGETTVAAYFVEWTPGHSENAANFDLVVGPWGPAAEPKSRKAVALSLNRGENGPVFSVLDAIARPIAKSDLVSSALSREQVIGKPIADTIFAICDEVWLHDQRLASLRSLFSGGHRD